MILKPTNFMEKFKSRKIAFVVAVVLYLLISMTSCKSLLVSGVEAFGSMYVEYGDKCEYQRCIVITRRLGLIGVNKLSFYLETDLSNPDMTADRRGKLTKGNVTKILIPEMEFNPAYLCYHGLCNGIPYTVWYTRKNGNVTIQVSRDDSNRVITLSTTDICHI